jgi:hypothetical protein
MFTLHHKVVIKQRAIMKKKYIPRWSKESQIKDVQKKVKSKMVKRKSNQR